jgi:Spy/CpxP family protein refolding chaperone
MNDRILKAVLIVSLAFNLAVVATVAAGWATRDDKPAWTGGVADGERMSIDDHGRQLSKCIGLSGKSAKCFEEAMASSSGEARKVKNELDRHRQRLLHLIQAGQPDEERIMAEVGEIAGLQGDLEKLLVKRLLDSRSVLEPDEDERLMYLIRCSMRPGCVGEENCPYRNSEEQRKEGAR